jgi:transcriptional regulator with XRE-family HTH domain
MDLNDWRSRREIAKRLRRARRRGKMSQARLAGKSGISQSSISRVEKGIATLHIGLLLLLACGLEVTIDVLLPDWQKYLPVPAPPERVPAPAGVPPAT